MIEKHENGSHWQSWAWVAVSVPIALALIIAELMHTHDQITIGNLDYFVMVGQSRLLPHTLSAWVHGMYPAGIPLIVRLGLALGADVVRTGQAASMLGGVLSLYGGAMLAWHLSRSRIFALLTMLLLLTTGSLLFYSGFEGTDMLSAGLQTLAFGVLVGDVHSRKRTAVAGVVLGLAYLIRYTSLMTMIIGAAYLVVLALVRRDRKLVRNLLWFVGGFLLAALPQLIPSALVKGQPFYQTQAYHIWAKLYASGDFISVARTAPYEITPWQLVRLDPGRFVTNWLTEIRRFWLTLDVPLVDQPLVQVARAGWLFVVFAEIRVNLERRALLGWFVLGITLFLSIFTIDTRFLLVLVPVFVVCAAYFLWRIVPARVGLGSISLPLNALVLAVLALALLPRTLAFARTSEGGPHAQVIEVSNMMHTAGMQAASKVVSSHHYYQDLASQTRDPFVMLFRLDAQESLGEFRRTALAAGYRFVLYDGDMGVRYHPQYQDLLVPEQRPSGFTPVWMAKDRGTIGYRLEADQPQPQSPMTQAFADAAVGDTAVGDVITLMGYDLYDVAQLPAAEGSTIGVYLYWEAERPVERSYKVFVHLMDANGDLVGQHDGVPALWTYRTWDWEPGEIVVDFHPLILPPGLSTGSYSLFVGLYDEETGVRLSRLQTEDTSVELVQIERGVQE